MDVCFIASNMKYSYLNNVIVIIVLASQDKVLKSVKMHFLHGWANDKLIVDGWKSYMYGTKDRLDKTMKRKKNRHST